MAAEKLSPIEREIKTRTRRIERNEGKIAEIKKQADEDIQQLKGEVERDKAILKALKSPA